MSDKGISLRDWITKQDPESVLDLMRAIVDEYGPKGPFKVSDDGADPYYVVAPSWGRIASDLEETEARLVAALLNWNNDQRADWIDDETGERDFKGAQ